MGTMTEGNEGRRRYQRYPAEFKREQLERNLRGEVTAAELSPELGVGRTLIQRWKHLVTKGGETAVGAEEEVVPASALKAAQQGIWELARAGAEDDAGRVSRGRPGRNQRKSRVGTARPRGNGAPRDGDLSAPPAHDDGEPPLRHGLQHGGPELEPRDPEPTRVSTAPRGGPGVADRQGSPAVHKPGSTTGLIRSDGRRLGSKRLY